MAEPLLISLSGLPGVGKSTIAHALARDLGALWLRIDSIEQAIRDAAVLREDVDAAGYLAAQAVAADNLRLGHIVIADCVNDWEAARKAWRDLADRARARVLEVLIVCSDIDEHRRRVETRETDVPGLRLPDWQATLARTFDPRTRDPLVIDTAGVSVETSVRSIAGAVRASRRDQSAPGVTIAANPASSTEAR